MHDPDLNLSAARGIVENCDKLAETGMIAVSASVRKRIGVAVLSDQCTQKTIFIGQGARDRYERGRAELNLYA